MSRALGEPFAWQVIQVEHTPTIAGIVLGPSGAGLEGVQVYLPEARRGGITDEDGRFEFDAPPPGIWLISLQMIGFEFLEDSIVVAPGAGVRIAAFIARSKALCTLACLSTSCTDVFVEAVDSTTGRPPEVAVRLSVEYQGQIKQSLTRFDPDGRSTTLAVGLGRTIETVGWHTIEIEADGYRPWRRERIWLELVPLCHGYLLGRSLRAALIPVGGKDTSRTP